MRRLNSHKYKTGRRFFRSLISLGTVLAIILIYHADVLSDVSITDYTAYPPFIGATAKPNVLINLDTSTSLGYFAYDFDYNAWIAPTETSGGAPRPVAPAPSTGYSSNTNYYGYFNPNTWYKYDIINEEWTKQSATSSDWKGNFLNWLTMRRSDIIKKALIGGKTKYRVGMITDNTDTHAHDLVGETPYADSQYLGYQKEISDTVLCGVSPIEDMGMGMSCLATESTIFTFDNDEVYRTGGKRRGWWLTGDIPAFSIGTVYEGDTPTNIYKVVIHLNNEPEGVIQRVGDNVRWGLEVINNGYETSDGRMDDSATEGTHGGGDETGGSRRGGGPRITSIKDVAGGTVLVPIGYDNIDDKEVIEAGVTVTLRGMVTEIASAAPYTPATPIAESLWTATGYFMQYDNGLTVDSDGPRYFSGATDRWRWGRGGRWGPRSTAASYPVGDDVDPYNYADDPANDIERVPCAKCFVITITDGEPTADKNVDTTIMSDAFNTTYTDLTTTLPGWEGADYFWQIDGSHYVDEVALYGHADPGTSYRDLRDGSINTGAVLDGKQYLTHYFIYAHFGGGTPDGNRLLNYSGAAGGGAARNGGFIDSNGDFLPDQQSEYDADGDGNNDTFFNVEDGHQLEAALTNAVYDIVNRASSGTAASMLANTAAGEGAVYQAYFYAEKKEGTEKRKWLGNINALFVDKNGNLREDSNNNAVLDSNDNIIKMGYSSENGTEIYKCNYTNEILNRRACPSTPEADGLDSINPVWGGGKSLWSTDPADRTIFTTVNGSTTIDFEATNSSTLQPYLRADDTTEADNIVNWIRGEDNSEYRKRDRTRNINGTDVKNIWKLGDIIHSTPTVVGKPVENYDLLYGDSSYTGFRSTYLKRRQVVYAGANDGMLHAFNAGCYNAAEQKYYPDVDSSGNCTSDTHSLGQELWAFIPRGLLPHLKWLTEPDYTHVYYVDLKPKITDVKIFSDDTTHVNGWGTILIGGFRYGGKDISWTSGLVDYTASPEYFALDITDPLNPRLLWTFSAPDLGLSMTYPSVAKVGENWYAIFGSGATDYDATSNLTGFQSGNVFVLNISGGTDGVIETWTEDTNFWKKATDTGITTAFMSDPITVDVDIDYNVDVIYLGENYNDVNWNAILHRITTNKGTQTNPADWTISTVANIETISGVNDVVKKITASPSVAMDDRANLWVFFGTGQFLGASDKNRTETGAFYAIKDGCWTGSSCSGSPNLMNMSSATVNINGVVSINSTEYSWPEFLTESADYDGWAIYFNARGEDEDFTGEVLNRSGERMVTKPFVLGGLVIWTTYIPGENACSTDGEGNLYAVYYKTGTAYLDYIFREQRDAAALVAGGGTTDFEIEEVGRVKKLGGKIGMPSALSAGVTTNSTVKGFAGQSTGGIVEIEVDSPISLKSDIINWANRPIP